MGNTPKHNIELIKKATEVENVFVRQKWFLKAGDLSPLPKGTSINYVSLFEGEGVMKCLWMLMWGEGGGSEMRK